MPHQIYAACIEACNACSVACNHCAAACLKEPELPAMAACIALDMDCAQMCTFTAGALARGSSQSQAICKLCAEFCQACGGECGKHDHAHCQACATACHQCAEECRKLAAMA